MNIVNFFAADTVTEVAAKLEQHCTNGGSITRSNLAFELGLSEPLPLTKVNAPAIALKANASEAEVAEHQAAKDAAKAYADQKHRNTTVENLLGSMINLGVLQGYENRKGPGGGIGKVNEKALREKGKAVVKPLTLDSGFVSLALSVMNERMPAGSDMRLSRKAIVEEMGVRDLTVKPGSDVEAFISAGIRQGEFPGFKTYRGPRGGVGRDDGKGPVVEAETYAASDTAETSEETATSEEVVVQTASKKSKKSKK